MFRRAVTIGVVAVALFVTYGGDTNAHYYVYRNGYLVHLFSFGCGIGLKALPNEPAVFQCTATVKEVEVLCENPAGHEVQPGRASTQVALVGQDIISPDEIEKNKGKANPEAVIGDDELLNPEYCVNPNWTPIDALAISVDAVLETYACTDETCEGEKELESVQTLECTLPPEFSVANPPPFRQPYDCIVTQTEHIKDGGKK